MATILIEKILEYSSVAITKALVSVIVDGKIHHSNHEVVTVNSGKSAYSETLPEEYWSDVHAEFNQD